MGPDYDMPSDLPRRRVAPLGWMFPLAFVVHGAMPGGAVLGFSAGVIPVPWKYVGIALSIPLPVIGPALVVAIALRTRGRIEAMREVERSGAWGSATVLDVAVLGGSSKGSEDGQRRRFQRLELRLRVQPPQGAPYELEHAAHFTIAEMERLARGAQLHVKIHPSDPARILVHPPAALPPPAAASPPGLIVGL